MRKYEYPLQQSWAEVEGGLMQCFLSKFTLKNVFWAFRREAVNFFMIIFIIFRREAVFFRVFRWFSLIFVLFLSKNGRERPNFLKLFATKQRFFVCVIFKFFVRAAEFF